MPFHVQFINLASVTSSSASEFFGVPTTSGDLLIVVITMAITGGGSPFVGPGGGASSISVTDTYLNTWQVAIDYTGTNRVAVLYAENITGGATHEIIVTTGADELFISEAIEVSGLLASVALDVTASHSTTDAAFTSDPATTTTDSSYMIGVHQYVGTSEDVATLNPDAGWIRLSGRGGSLTKDYIQERVSLSASAYESSGIISISGVVGWPVTSVMVAFKGVVATVVYTADTTVSLASITITSAASEAFTATANVSLLSLSGILSAAERFTAIASVSLQPAGSAGFISTYANEIFNAIANVSLAAVTVTASAAFIDYPATVNQSLLAVTVTASSSETFEATIDAILMPLSASSMIEIGATGTAVIVAGSWNGSGTTLTLIISHGSVISASAI